MTWRTNEVFLMFQTWVKERSVSIEEAFNQKQALQQRISREIASLSEKYGCTLAQLVIAWCLKNDAVQSMLIGPTSTAELVTYIQALQVLIVLSVPHRENCILNYLLKNTLSDDS